MSAVQTGCVSVQVLYKLSPVPGGPCTSAISWEESAKLTASSWLLSRPASQSDCCFRHTVTTDVRNNQFAIQLCCFGRLSCHVCKCALATARIYMHMRKVNSATILSPGLHITSASGKGSCTVHECCLCSMCDAQTGSVTFAFACKVEDVTCVDACPGRQISHESRWALAKQHVHKAACWALLTHIA